jgi:aspartate 1-decarboxylase
MNLSCQALHGTKFINVREMYKKQTVNFHLGARIKIYVLAGMASTRSVSLCATAVSIWSVGETQQHAELSLDFLYGLC